jgi:hypothetical protein
MSNLNSRINKLETAQGMGARMGYMCVISEGWAAGLDSPEERARGYKVQPYIRERGGTGGEPFYIQTREELDQFAARPDVELLIIRVGHENEAGENSPA